MKTTVEQGRLTATSGSTNEQISFEVLDLGPFDNNRNDLQALNDKGQRVGVSANPATGRIEAFSEESGVRDSLGTLGGSFSVARDVNNSGEIVGGSLTDGDTSFHGFLYREKRLYDLNELLDTQAGWELIQAFAINNNSEILGIGSRDGNDRIVLLRPKR